MVRPAAGTKPHVEVASAGHERDPLATLDRVLAARRRPMAERLEVALSWNSMSAELRAGLHAKLARSAPADR